PEIQIDYADRLEDIDAEEQRIESRFSKTKRAAWDTYLRGAGAPPVKTPEGWLVLYHAITENEPDRYRIGAMLLDLDDPTKVIARSAGPLLSPDMPYENHWKPGIVYTCGAVVKDGTFFLYYGGGDRHVCVAHAPISQILYDLKHDRAPALSPAEAVMA
ncbi:MAG TPA: hypothetical protein VFL98_03530, partial [Candidatus Paceibacterota bacterium]|nr:hypothetical protein [Candidatus Paceibacterota bacterium]